MDILLAFTSVTVFTLMLTIGVGQTFEQLTSLWRQRGVLLRSLLSVLVLVPAVVIVLLLVFDLPPAVVTGLAVLAAAPGAPLTTKRSQMAGADLTYVSPLQLTLALLAVVVTPLILAIFYPLFELTIERVTPFEVASQVVRVTFLPVVIGLLLQRFAPKLVAVIGKPECSVSITDGRGDRCHCNGARVAGKTATGMAGDRGDSDHGRGCPSDRPPTRGPTPRASSRARHRVHRPQYRPRLVHRGLE